MPVIVYMFNIKMWSILRWEQRRKVVVYRSKIEVSIVLITDLGNMDYQWLHGRVFVFIC